MKGLSVESVRARIQMALREDIAGGDITSRLSIPQTTVTSGKFISRDDGILAGVGIAALVFEEIDPSVDLCRDLSDSTRLSKGSLIANVRGAARAILAAERLALNFLQRLSGIATLTGRFVEAVRGTRARIYDTRKTTPLWRDVEKYAVRVGGGFNHRMSLAEAVLLKDNHIKLMLPAGPSPGRKP